jgi:hypothetical protein
MAGAKQARARGSPARGDAGGALGRRENVAGVTIGSASAGLGRAAVGVVAVPDRGELNWTARAGEDRSEAARRRRRALSPEWGGRAKIEFNCSLYFLGIFTSVLIEKMYNPISRFNRSPKRYI